MAVFVFDCGGTLMEYAGIPASWSNFYPAGFRAVADALCPACTESDIAGSAAQLAAFNPRVTGRETEYSPAELFAACTAHWPAPAAPEKAAAVFFQSLRLTPEIYPDSIPTLRRLRDAGHKTAILTDLPSGMPDALFRADIAPLLPHIDPPEPAASASRTRPASKRSPITFRLTRTHGLPLSPRRPRRSGAGFLLHSLLKQLLLCSKVLKKSHQS